MNLKQDLHTDEQLDAKETVLRKVWRKPSLTELDLEQTETGNGPFTDTTNPVSSS